MSTIIFPSQEPTRKAWQGMMNRCYTATNKDYPGVGGKGIVVQPSWHVYENFLADMGEKPEDTILTRYAEGLGFSVENTYWQPKIHTRSNRLYSIWKGIRRRCGLLGASKGDGDYFERGINMCPEWDSNFASFAADVGEPPSDEHSLDRIDNARGYWPGNVQWATSKEQANNREDNVYIEMGGERKTLQQWCDYYEVDRTLVAGRWRVLFAASRGKNRQVQQIDPSTGALIREFAGVKQAAVSTGILQGTLAKCLSGGNATAGNFAWRYAP